MSNIPRIFINSKLRVGPWVLRKTALKPSTTSDYNPVQLLWFLLRPRDNQIGSHEQFGRTDTSSRSNKVVTVGG